ncbi:MAG: hypothetical protein M0Z51_13130 [Propionibacterium sp.]|nr:hypothetical protein [Propionibacterium sp.]
MARYDLSTSYPIVKTLPGRSVNVLCQTLGLTVAATSVWDRLSDGNYVSDYYLSTPSKTTFSSPLPRCTYSYQVAVSGSVNLRSGPGTQYSIVGSIPNGGLAAVTCQKSGGPVSTTHIWDRLDNGTWGSATGQVPGGGVAVDPSDSG